jgi:UDP-GlcNAc3NAcA epimerase
MKIVTVIGARPQFVKAAVVSREIRNRTGIEEVLIHTGQHFDANMSEIFFEEMKIPRPHYNLEISGLSHGAMTGRMFEAIEKVLFSEKPDIVLVYGDTNSTLAGALAAVKLHIPVGHVEAGLRSFNFNMPEEVNRILTDRISKWLLCPTETAIINLAAEGIMDKGRDISSSGGFIVKNTGDVMYDAALYYKSIAVFTAEIEKILSDYKNGFYLATIHRAENTDDPQRLSSIMKALNGISEKIPVILPLHPRTRKFIEASDFSRSLYDRIKIIDPVGYFDMIGLLSNCSGVFTDSGGVQKEACFFQKLCVTLRDETEWVELVKNGFNELAGADYDNILAAEKNLSNKKTDFSKKLYGDGNAGKRIVDILSGK